MTPPDQKKYLFDNPRNVQRVIRGLLIVCGVLLALDAVIHRHVYHPWEALFGFYSFYGFVSCVLLVVLAKQMRKVVMRDERYYEDRAEARRASIDSGRPESGDGSDHA